MEISILVAVAENGVIGYNNELVWHLRDDLQLFKKRTLNHTILMGRKTFDSIGKPLPKRNNIVISRNENLHIQGVTVVNSLSEALELVKQEEEVFIIGGQKIFELAAPFATKLYLTSVKASPEGDVFFDLSPYLNWEVTDRVLFEKSDDNEFDFDVLEMRKPHLN